MEIAWEIESGLPHRVGIYVDGERKKKVSLSIVSLHDLKALPRDERFFASLLELEVKGGIRYALFCLARQALHSKKLERLLSRHFLDRPVIAQVLEHCQHLGLFCDSEWIERKVQRWQAQGKSGVDIKSRLFREGISSVEVGSDDSLALENLIARKYPQLLEAKTPYKERMRALQSLQRRGFSFQIVKEFLQKKDLNGMMEEEIAEEE